jgi:hypothetical protein
VVAAVVVAAVALVEVEVVAQEGIAVPLLVNFLEAALHQNHPFLIMREPRIR